MVVKIEKVIARHTQTLPQNQYSLNVSLDYSDYIYGNWRIEKHQERKAQKVEKTIAR